MIYPHTPHCGQCVDRKVCDKLEIVEVVSDPPNHAMERRQLMELMAERSRLKADAEEHLSK